MKSIEYKNKNIARSTNTIFDHVWLGFIASIGIGITISSAMILVVLMLTL